MKKKLLASLMTVVVAAGALCASVGAWHYVPNKLDQFGNQIRCNNTYTDWRHLSAADSINVGEHILSGGATCYIYMQNYPHVFSCTACRKDLNTIVSRCTTFHSNCSDHSVSHNF